MAKKTKIQSKKSLGSKAAYQLARYKQLTSNLEQHSICHVNGRQLVKSSHCSTINTQTIVFILIVVLIYLFLSCHVFVIISSVYRLNIYHHSFCLFLVHNIHKHFSWSFAVAGCCHLGNVYNLCVSHLAHLLITSMINIV